MINNFMIDLRNLKGGKKLIKKIIGDDFQDKKSWSKKNQYQSIAKQKNCLTPAIKNKK